VPLNLAQPPSAPPYSAPPCSAPSGLPLHDLAPPVAVPLGAMPTVAVLLGAVPPTSVPSSEVPRAVVPASWLRAQGRSMWVPAPV